MKYLVTLALLFSGVAHAQRATPCNPVTPNSAVCITYSAVTKRTDGSNVTGTMTYRTEQKSGSGAYTTSGTTSALQFYVQNLAPGTYTFRVIALEGTVASDPSNEASRSVVQAPPEATVIQVAQVVIGVDHAPVYSIIAGDRRGEEVIGFVPVGAPCSGNVVFRFRDKSYRRVSCNDVKTWGVQCRNPAAACAKNG